MTALLEVSGLSVFYGEFQALFGVDLEVNRGETVAIIGANGAGKSTLLRSRAGLGLSALRDSEPAANVLGVDTRRLKLGVFVLCALCTGLVGGAIYLNFLRIAPEPAFTVRWTAFMIFITMIGGIGTIEGPIIGTALFMLFRNDLSNFGEWSMILFGALAIVMMLFAPQGVWGLLHERFGVELFRVRRRLT